MDAMNVFGAVTGVAVGVLQLVLLSAVSARITGVRKDGLAASAAVILFFRDSLLSCGIGYAVGMAGAAVFAAICGRK